ncbi:MAG: hypothetical protein J7L88_00560, partial [Thermoplasmata archaeon]|nr:hypothetical protein [Thermoplasmata archaeon]
IVWSGVVNLFTTSYIKSNQTLIIMPGTRVIARDALTHISVSGRIFANGTPSSPILFESIGIPWSGIQIEGGVGYFTHVSIRNASTAFSIIDGRAEVRNTTVSSSSILVNMDGESYLLWVNSTIQKDACIVDLDSTMVVKNYFKVVAYDPLYGPLSEGELHLADVNDRINYNFPLDENGSTPFTEVVSLVLPQIDVVNYTLEILSNGYKWYTTHYSPYLDGNLIENITHHLPPTPLNFSSNYTVEEDTFWRIPLRFARINNVSVDFEVTTSTPLLSWDPENSTLLGYIPDPKRAPEEVDLHIRDPISTSSYKMILNVLNKNDPPVVSFGRRCVQATPGRITEVPIYLYDEETERTNLVVNLSQPWAHYNRSGESVLLMLDRPIPPTTLYINVTDENGTTSSASIIVLPLYSYTTPSLLQPLPHLLLKEDGECELDLKGFFTEDAVDFRVIAAIGAPIRTFLNNSILRVSSGENSWGEASVLVEVSGWGEAKEWVWINITILPENDPPLLLSPSFSGEGPLYTFSVTYVDPDGEAPRLLSLVLDGVEHPMKLPNLFLDYVSGVRFSVTVGVSPGRHTFYFRATDPWGYQKESAPMDIVAETDLLPGRISLGSVTATYVYNGQGSVSMDVRGGAPEKKRVGAYVYLNTTIFISATPGTEIKNMTIWIPLKDITDIDYLSTSIVALSFADGNEVFHQTEVDEGHSMLTIHIHRTPPPSIHLFALPSPSRDSDGDGVPDLQDLFPDDPLEWRDTDGDGIGDAQDTDDDGDGVSDEEEIQFGGDPLSPMVLPPDTDSDGTPDLADDDIDGDGIPNWWEEMMGLDPYNPEDASMDMDHDGISNLEEYRAYREGCGESNSPPASVILLYLLIPPLLLGVIYRLKAMGIILRKREEFEVVEGRR